uniref:Nudix hydrolase domain-containing protein n=1 Tax=Eptatretus burgeri TaxID=7764 RepID=A0A8C4PYN1_EPTBU
MDVESVPMVHQMVSLSREESLRLVGHQHACHAMIYASCPDKIFGKIPVRYAVLMQMRFDGRLGFPGGFMEIRDGGFLEAGFNRELASQLGIQPGLLRITEREHVLAHVMPVSGDRPIVAHFYMRELSLPQLRDVEMAALGARDFGAEVMRTVRVPLYTLRDGVGGLPAFLCNSFASMAREQLLWALAARRLLPPGRLREACETARVPVPALAL